MLFTNSVKSGIVSGMLLHLIQIPLMPTVVLPLAFGLSQAIYMVPAIIWANKRSFTEFRKGILIVVGISFLLNALCTGIILVSLSTASFR